MRRAPFLLRPDVVSFALTAVGLAPDVRNQLAAADMMSGGALGEATRSLLVAASSEFEGGEYPGQRAALIVKASGHSDASTLSLNISIETVWVPVPKDDG